MSRIRLLFFLGLILGLSQAHALGQEQTQPTQNLVSRIETYNQRYGLQYSTEKLVNNRGEGFDPLYGVRNMRVVLYGTFYRGGANNYYHRTQRRDNRNPLPNDGLENLCQEGFSEAIYLYATNFSTAPKAVGCDRRFLFKENIEATNLLKYSQIGPYNPASIQKIMGKIYERVIHPELGPLYAHCWNGWHASGLISAMVLRQFCSWSPDQAVDYWDRNTDGNNKDPHFKKIRQQIRDYKPDPQWQISPEAQMRICPELAPPNPIQQKPQQQR